MKTPSRATWRSVMPILVLLAAAPDGSAQPPTELSPSEVDLRRQVVARFEVVPLRDGIALAGATPERHLEIDNGVVLAGGVPLSGEELRRRLGADAAVVLRLSYLDNATLRRLFAAPPLTARAAGSARAARACGRAASPVPLPAAPAPVSPPAPPVVDRPAPVAADRIYRRTGARLAVGKSIVIAEDEDVTEAVVAVGGNVRIDGRVRDDVVVLGGDLVLSSTAEVRGDITVIGGEVTMAPGARHIGELHHGVSGRFPGWRWPVIAWSRVDLGPAGRWLSLAGTLMRVALLALAVMLVMVVARGRVARIGAVATATPIRAGLVGLLTQVLFVPALVVAAVLLAITIVGIPFVAVLIPLAVIALGVTMLLGFTSLAQRLGQAVAGRGGWSADAAIGAAVLGMAVIVLPTIVSRLIGMALAPVGYGAVALLGLGAAIEYVAWTIGLGAAVMTGLGRWATVPPPLPPHAVAEAPSGL